MSQDTVYVITRAADHEMLFWTSVHEAFEHAKTFRKVWKIIWRRELELTGEMEDIIFVRRAGDTWEFESPEEIAQEAKLAAKNIRGVKEYNCALPEGSDTELPDSPSAIPEDG